MSNKNLIGIAGKKRHGKDTLGDYLVKNHGYAKIGFADALKEGCRHIFGLTEAQLYGDDKETDDPFWKTSPRTILQYVGTELFRNQLAEIMPEIGDNIWIKVVEKIILENPDKKYVITDVRFANEMEFVKKYGGITVKVQRDIGYRCDASNHLSESFIDDLQTDYIIENNGTLCELYEKLDYIMKHQ